MAFKDIFKDENYYNEKTIVGFISDTVFNSFVIITLGAFGIAEAGKIFGKKGNDQE